MAEAAGEASTAGATRGTIFRVELTSTNRETGRPNYINFRCGYPDVARLAAALNDGVIVVGEKLRCRRVPGGGRTFRIVGAEPWALGRGGFTALGAPNVEILDDGDETDGEADVTR